MGEIAPLPQDAFDANEKLFMSLLRTPLLEPYEVRSSCSFGIRQPNGNKRMICEDRSLMGEAIGIRRELVWKSAVTSTMDGVAEAITV